MNSKSLSAFRSLLITLITATAITGISFLDDHIWNIVMAIVGVVAYGIVGLLYSTHLISGKKAGKEAYAAIFIILLIIGVLIYNGILNVEQWILSWPLYVKILILSVMGAGIIAVSTLLIISRIKKSKKPEINNQGSNA